MKRRPDALDGRREATGLSYAAQALLQRRLRIGAATRGNDDLTRGARPTPRGFHEGDRGCGLGTPDSRQTLIVGGCEKSVL